MLLESKRLTKIFGGVRALWEVSLSLERGEILGLIGPNGSGKTTLVNVITGTFQPDSGEVFFNGKPIAGLRPNEIVRKGLARTFQGLRLFYGVSCLESLLMSQAFNGKNGLMDIVLNNSPNKFTERNMILESIKALRFVGLEHLKDRTVRDLSLGEQQKLSIAMALTTEPKLILIDEPAAGMRAEEKADLVALLRRIQQNGIAVLVIDHDMKVIMKVCERVMVLDNGEKIADGPPDEISEDARVIEAYLGKE